MRPRLRQMGPGAEPPPLPDLHEANGVNPVPAVGCGCGAVLCLSCCACLAVLVLLCLCLAVLVLLCLSCVCLAASRCLVSSRIVVSCRVSCMCMYVDFASAFLREFPLAWPRPRPRGVQHNSPHLFAYLNLKTAASETYMTGDDSRDSSSAFGAGSVALERGSSPRGGHTAGARAKGSVASAKLSEPDRRIEVSRL